MRERLGRGIAAALAFFAVSLGPALGFERRIASYRERRPAPHD